MKKMVMPAVVVGLASYLSVGLARKGIGIWYIVVFGVIFSTLIIIAINEFAKALAIKKEFDEDQKKKDLEHKAFLAGINNLPKDVDLDVSRYINREISKGDSGLV